MSISLHRGANNGSRAGRGGPRGGRGGAESHASDHYPASKSLSSICSRAIHALNIQHTFPLIVGPVTGLRPGRPAALSTPRLPLFDHHLPRSVQGGAGRAGSWERRYCLTTMAGSGRDGRGWFWSGSGLVGWSEPGVRTPVSCFLLGPIGRY